MARTACSITSKSFLAQARVLARSFHEHHPEVPFHLLLIDEVEGCFEPEEEPFRLLSLADLGLAEDESLRFRYTRQQLAYACTPSLLRHLIEQGFDRVLFLKEESLVTGPMEAAFEFLDEHDALLVPHLLEPGAGERAAEHECRVLLSGAYNAGLVGTAATAGAKEFLAWWEDRLQIGCLHRIEEGLHFEQRWLDLAPSYFPGVGLLRDPTYDVAHWNLSERRVEYRGGALLARGRPIQLFRFSGFDPDEPDFATRYQPRYPLELLGDAARAYREFHARLLSEGHQVCRRWPYTWDRFEGGIPIPEPARNAFRRLESEQRSPVRPFSRERQESFFAWLLEPATPNEMSCRPTNLWMQIWHQRPDVIDAFPDPLGSDREAFLSWTRSSGVHEHGIPRALWGPDAG